MVLVIRQEINSHSALFKKHLTPLDEPVMVKQTVARTIPKPNPREDSGFMLSLTQYLSSSARQSQPR